MMAKIYKQYVCKADVNDEERTVTAVINTAAIDRDKEIVLPKGADLEQYLKNPVVQWAHDYSAPPVAKALWVKKGRKNIKAKMKFATKEQSPKADEIYQLYKGGFLNAFSIGFITKEGHPPTPDELKGNPDWAEARYIIDNWEMLEFSAVPVPANPEALALAVKSKEVSISSGLAEELKVEQTEDEETFYPTKAVEDEDKESLPVKPIAMKMEAIPVKVAKVNIKVLPFNHKVSSFVDIGDVASDAILKVRGRIYKN